MNALFSEVGLPTPRLSLSQPLRRLHQTTQTEEFLIVDQAS